MEYKYSEIEQKWQQYWEENRLYEVAIDTTRPKYYVLDMFPYPSGSGLHVGHPLGYIASDIFSRFKRHQGFNVLHPMGYDAFGLPAEQYAIETGQHPEVTTQININRFRNQLKAIGFCYDWSREISTADPAYYRWTQWIFLQLFKSWYNNATGKAEPIETLVSHFEKNGTFGLNAATTFVENFSDEQWKQFSDKEKGNILLCFRLAYLSWSEVNWCPALGTVLANDEVKDGRSERGNHPVERIKMRQWFLRITAYADRLLQGLDHLDWPASLIEMQKNWIGRSEGATVFFNLAEGDGKIEIFTTRPDTIFGATFMVLAPEHELVEKITTPSQRAEVEQYLAYVKSRTDVERQQEKKVTGAFTGAYAINPFTGKNIPVWIAEYVLAGYGTGAIMAVPADDDRDNAFAEKFGLPIVEIIDKSMYPGAGREDKLGKMVNSDFLDGQEVKDAIAAILSELEKRKIGNRKVNYKIRDAGFSRQRYWGEPFPIVYQDDIPRPIDEKELPLLLPQVDSYKPSGDGQSPLARLSDWVNIDPETKRETDTMPGYAGSSWYFLRYMDPKNPDRFTSKEAESYWKNVDFYIGGAEHAVGHLLYARFWHKFLFDRGLVSTDEPFQKLVNQGMIQGRSNFVYRIKDTNTFVSNGLKGQYETTPLHVDVNIVHNDRLNMEKFRQWREDFRNAEFILENGEYLCGWEVEKMSKSRHNTVSPDDLIRDYGADTLRLYEMFLGPVEMSKPWNTQGIEGVAKFLRKLWRLFFDDKGNFLIKEETPNAAELKILHKTIKKITEDIERFSLNTAVSAYMICVNELSELKCHKKSILQDFLILLSPFAPHIAEELWHKLGNESTILNQPFPVCNEEFLVETGFEYPISINGKLRSKIFLALDLGEEQVREAVLAQEVVQKWLEEKPLRKFIFVKGKIVNLVV